jgi:hypothetical protein
VIALEVLDKLLKFGRRRVRHWSTKHGLDLLFDVRFEDTHDVLLRGERVVS